MDKNKTLHIEAITLINEDLKEEIEKHRKVRVENMKDELKCREELNTQDTL